MAEKFDVIVVGAGPSGNSCAYTCAKAGLKVLQIERGEYSGSKNVQGAILYADALERVIPDFREDAPLERHIIEQRMWCLDDTSYMGANYRSDDFNEEKPNRYTILRAQFDKWFNGRVRDAGALVICETTVTELVKDGAGKVIGVRTDRLGEDILADVVVLADGANSLLAKRAGFHPELRGDTVALAVKETIFMPPENIESRFNLNEEEGVVIEMVGSFTHGMVGTGFLYTNRESISLGVGCIVSDFKYKGISPYTILDEMKKHPVVKPLIAGGETKEYVAHLIPEGGYNAIPQLFGDGWMLVGDAGHFVNAVHREGSNLAMTTGRIAAETIIYIKDDKLSFSKSNLAMYKDALNQSFVMKDLKKYASLPDTLHHNKQFFEHYPSLITRAAQTMLRVDGVDKKTKQKQIARSFREKRSLTGLFTDAYKLLRAFR